ASACMSSDADRKSPLADPLLILIALLLLLATAATLYFIPAGASKSYAIEPGARPRPVITNQVVVVKVEEVVAAPASGHGHAAPAVSAEAPAHGEPTSKPAEPADAKPEAPAAPVAVSVAAPVVTPTTDGKVRGHVVLKGTPPPEKVIGAVKNDGNCGKVATGTAMTRNFVVGPDGGLRYALVRVTKAPGGNGKAAAPFLLDQAGCMYEPYISAIQTGQTLQIRNSDPFMHNVACTTKPGTGNKGFNIAQASAGKVDEKVFESPELSIRFACNVHPWMIAFVHVIEHPFFVMTDDKGAFELPAGLPPGTYELEVNHPRAGSATQSIEVAAGRGAEVVFELGVPAK
ncbi:MAG: hypothetical protein KIT22_03845, partial [Verrucomicrobiae bacterium]|nr:hypothetical protein [Verrucomicrobiae bacterium]